MSIRAGDSFRPRTVVAAHLRFGDEGIVAR
jgi:hypothetical protein